MFHGLHVLKDVLFRVFELSVYRLNYDIKTKANGSNIDGKEFSYRGCKSKRWYIYQFTPGLADFFVNRAVRVQTVARQSKRLGNVVMVTGKLYVSLV